jgi:Fe-Mn family superoxide dismutase
MYKTIELDYTNEQLKNFIDEQTMELHFNTLYKGYLNRLNQLLSEQNYDFRYSKEELVNNIEEFPLSVRDDILYNLGGVLNHERYFSLLTPEQKESSLPILNKIEDTYGSLSNFEEEFKNQASNLVGSGYTNLVLDKSGNLNIINTSNQEIPDIYGFQTLLSLDLWEHAYFLKYYQDKEEYIDQFFNYIDYDKVNTRYEEAQNQLQEL